MAQSVGKNVIIIVSSWNSSHRPPNLGLGFTCKLNAWSWQSCAHKLNWSGPLQVGFFRSRAEVRDGGSCLLEISICKGSKREQDGAEEERAGGAHTIKPQPAQQGDQESVLLLEHLEVGHNSQAVAPASGPQVSRRTKVAKSWRVSVQHSLQWGSKFFLEGGSRSCISFSTT